jgi:hypothetical protein
MMMMKAIATVMVMAANGNHQDEKATAHKQRVGTTCCKQDGTATSAIAPAPDDKRICPGSRWRPQMREKTSDDELDLISTTRNLWATTTMSEDDDEGATWVDDPHRVKN